MPNLASALLPLAAALAACGSAPSEGLAPGVLLVVVDALRADHLSGAGYDRETSPFLDELARSGVRFEQVFASAPQLIPAHAALLTGCESESATVEDNMTKAADNFEVHRRIVVINGITDQYLFTIEGRCSIADEGNQLEVLCKIAEGDDPNSYVKHMFRMSDNVTYIVEQLGSVPLDPFHHTIVFRPESIIPDVDLQTSGG